MTSTYFRAGALACALLASTALASPAFGQSAPSAPPPLHDNVDANGVDLVTGKFRYGFTEAVIGSGEGAISLQRLAGDDGFRTNWSGGLYTAPDGFVYAEFGGLADSFSCTGATCTSRTGNGATLVGNVYTARDGTQVEYLTSGQYPLQGYDCPNGVARGDCAIPVSVTRPSGMKFTVHWTMVDKCTVVAPDCEGGIGTTFYRFEGVSSSAGYSFDVGYLTNNPGNAAAPQPDWYKKTGVSFANSETACTSACPSLTYSTSGAFTITDNIGRQWKPGSSSVQFPGDNSPSLVATISSGVVTSVTNRGVTTSYSRSVAGNVSTMTVTDALSNSRVIKGDIAKGRVTSVKDELDRTTSFQYDSDGRLTRTTMPEGNYVELSYDARGNVTQSKAVAKTAGTPPDIITTASYPASCTNPKTCNQPLWTKDAKLKQTDYTYDANHGGVVTVTAPEPTAGAVRPQTRFGYTLTVPPVAGQPSIYLPTSVSACQTLSSCTDGADETRQVTSYAGNLLPQTVTARNGTGTLSATQTMTYDPAGNVLTVQGPLGAAYTTTYRYDGARRQVGIISPDPDGGGALKRRATRITYRPDSQVSKQELGNVNGTTDPDWAAFAPQQAIDIGYSSSARPLTWKLSGGSVATMRQVSYDALGRPECSAVRMNPPLYGALPSSACTLTTQGSFGPDRITRTIYDAAGQVTERRVAVGVAGQEAAEATFTYTDNGKLHTLKDAENNLTTYFYDGFDRLSETRFPTKSPKGAGTSDPNGYELLTYDANGNVLTFQDRANEVTQFTYDALNRLTSKVGLPVLDVYYGYDNLDRLLSAKSAQNQGTTNTYDALGRKLSEAGLRGTVVSEYDIAGRRTKLTYPGGGLYVTYDYLVTGEMEKIRENGAPSGVGVLAAYAYDNLGRRTSTTFGNGAVQAYGYDPVSRLASLTNNLSGTANDLSATFTYNPASQIVSTVRTGDNYAWTDHANVNVTGTPNGLNQLTQVGAKALTHDARGNVTAFGTDSFTYNGESQLIAGPGGSTLSYDPGVRLYQTVSDGAVLRMAYDGLERVAEYDGSDVIQRRYVYGPGMDQPLVQYEGTGTSNRRFLSSDERGSIISVTDSSGALLGINRYDEYGSPQPGFTGTFGYTGQAWLPGINAWYYKARVYEPELGRFLQADPAGGTNRYAYVGNDPIAFADPSGMVRQFAGEAGDDMSRFVDFTPQGTGWGQHSWDWGGQMAMSEASRSAALSYMSHTIGVSIDCLLTCSLDYVYTAAAQNIASSYVPENRSLPRDQLACVGRYTTACLKALNDALKRVIPEIDPKALPLPPGVSRADFGAMAGFGRGLNDTPLRSAEDIARYTNNLRGAGFSRSDIAIWRNFYQDQAWRNPANTSAVHRAGILNRIWWRMLLGR